MILTSVFVALILATIIGRLQLIDPDPAPEIVLDPGSSAQADPAACDDGDCPSTLFAYIHGLERGKHWPAMREQLSGHGDTLMLSYPNPLVSNADPVKVAEKIADELDERFKQKPYDRIVLIGQSMGALIVKRAFLNAEASNMPWTRQVERVVLVAGMNRGWDISGKKPSDMGFFKVTRIWAGSWIGRMLGIGGLGLSTEAGTPFVANTRIDWLNRMRSSGKKPVEVVQLLGDIDDLVSQEDNKDLQSIKNGKFAWLKVRGTGHGNIANFADKAEAGGLRLGEYRKQKFILATTADFDVIARENEVQPFEPDRNVKQVVFVVHGIRDLGEWAATFESYFQDQFRAEEYDRPAEDKIKIASIRYGYFGMGPFLFKPIREKYVKWFMDEYTETLARYPNYESVHFVGHSNGTYLMAAALERYSSLRFDRVVFGGSVVRKNYDWDKQLARLPDLQVRNFRAVDDWVVGLFPRFFEPAVPQAIFRNDIGSAGYFGFEQQHKNVKNIPGLTGGHGAFLSQAKDIAAYVVNGVELPPESDDHKSAGVLGKLVASITEGGATWATWFIVWPLIAGLLIVVGWHVITAAPEPRTPMALAYIFLLLYIFRNV